MKVHYGSLNDIASLIWINHIKKKSDFDYSLYSYY